MKTCMYYLYEYENVYIYYLPLTKRFCAKGDQENDKTMTMAPLGFLNEDVTTAGSTVDIRVHYIYPDSYLSKT